MNLYEFNKAGYACLANFDQEDINHAKKNILEYLKNHPSKYYLMLSNEAHYYTIYTFKEDYKFKQMSEEIMNIVKDLGDIKSIEIPEDNSAIEFWIMYNGECHLFYLFDYTQGVVEI